MNRRQRTVSRRCLWLAGGISGLLAISMASLWYNYKSSAELDGRYSSSGQIQLNDGSIIETFHNIRFSAGRFYALTQQGRSIMETSGRVDYGFLGHYRLVIEHGSLNELSPNTDDELIFNLMYGRHEGSTIHLVPFHGCLYTQETRQAYCAMRD